MVAARNGGGDPTSNLSLRYAIDEAKYANMPRDTIERAVQKGTGEGDTSTWETIRYEGYAPGGVAVIVDALTNNRTRTAADVRNAFADHGGNVGTSGCVAYLFDARGEIVIDGAPGEPPARGQPAPPPLSEDRVMEVALEAGALDVVAIGDEESPAFQVLTDPGDFQRVKDAIEKAGLRIAEAALSLIPQTRTEVSGEQAQAVEAIVEELEELDDVQKVYTNVAG